MYGITTPIKNLFWFVLDVDFDFLSNWLLSFELRPAASKKILENRISPHFLLNSALDILFKKHLTVNFAY